MLKGTSAATPAPGTRIPGPRQEYLDAFDDKTFGGGAFATPPPRGGAPRSAYARAQWDASSGGGAGSPGADAFDGAGDGDREGDGGGDTDRQRAPRARQTGKARAFTGVAAAAVTTVLAVVIAGQVAGGSDGKSDSAGSTVDDKGQVAGSAAHTSHTGPKSPSAPASPSPPAYTDKMAQLLSVKPDFKGKGSFSTVPGHAEAPARGAQRPMRYRVDIEKGFPLDGKLFAQAAQKTLNDKRSWAHGGAYSFERVDSGHADFVLTLASPKTTDVWCAKSGLDTSEEHVSCDSASTDRVMINGYRWARGAKTFGDGKIYPYRQMLLNHEVGHRLGHGHVGCPKDGALAPVMMQQTKFLTTNGAKCRPNSWPFPRG